MATPDPSDTVKDREYTNWLKVTLALYYMKSGLHTFIQSEIDCLHQSLVKKIYAGQPVPLSPCTTCNASLVRRNNHTGVWKFQTQCTLSCDVWFCELLALHNNPKSNKIYWANSDVSLWSFKPWECAKVFLPRGQQPTNTGPAESDAQALMVLLTNCKHFHPKLSQQGQTLTHKISAIRNQVMHDGEMKVSDGDRMNFVQDIIQMLEDPVCLKSLEDCKAAVCNIQKINNDSLDVFFNVDTEMKALKAAVNELRQEHGIQEKVLNTIDSLKEECKNLREQLTERFKDAEKELQLHGVRMDTIQRDVQLVKEETDTALKEQEEKCQEMHAAVTQLSESMATMSAQNESRFVVVEENMQAFGRKLEELETNTLTQRENNSYRIRTSAGEETSDCDISEAPSRRKRPESDGLQQLKNQTEDDLDTFRKRGFIPTSQTEEARKLLQEKRSIVIKGNPGEGKTSTALHLIDNDNYTDWRVVISSPEQWSKVDTKWVKIVVVEDIFGQYDLDPSRLQEWIDTYLKKIQNHVDEGKLQAIITIRDDIFSKASSKLKSFKLFRSDRSLTLRSDELQNADKKNILDRELKRNNKDMTVDKIEQCIANFKGLIGFPQCCTLFAGNEDLFVQGPDFFKSPEKFLVDNIRNLKADSFLSLAFLFCSNGIEEEYLSPSQIKESKKYLPILEDLANYLNIPFNESTVISLRLSYEHYSGLYVKKVSSCQDHSGENLPYVQHSRENVSKSCIQFSHATIYEAVGQVLGDSYPEMVVKYGGSRYLYQRTYTAEAKDGDSQNVFIPLSVYGLLAERMVHDVVEKKTVESVVKHSSLKQNEFLTKLKEELHKVNRIRDFFMADPYFQHKFLWHVSKVVSEGECITFLQHVLQSDDSTVKLVYNHFMEFLACTHNNNSSDCWQCKEKQKLLELALYYHHFEIADQLITMNACYTHVSLYNAARHGDLNRVQMIMEYLKRSQIFNPKCVEARKALCRAYLSRSQDVIETLLKEGITLDSMHVVHAVQYGDISILMKVVEHLKYHNKWHPHRAFDRYGSFFTPDVYSGQTAYFAFAPNELSGSIALYIAYCIEKFDMADYLLQNEAKVSLNMLAAVTEHSSKEAVARVIQHLKVNCIWDPHCDDASQALGKAYVAQKYDVCDMLIQEGVLMTMKNLHCVVVRFMTSLKAVKKAVTYLKDIDNWDPKCNDASKALEKAYSYHNYDVCDLLIEKGVSVTMKYIPHVILKPLDYVKKVMKQLKDTGRWDPKCNSASKALALAYGEKKYDVCDLLIEEGVLLTMKNLPCVVMGLNISLEATKKAVQHLKDTNNWEPKCDDASEALADAYRAHKYDVCNLLSQEGVSLTMENLPHVVGGFGISLEAVKKAVQHLKDTKNWDNTCKDASKALEEVFRRKKYDVCDLLIEEGVSLTMKNLPHVVGRFEISLEAVKKAVQHLKDTKNWDPNCEDASIVLQKAFERKEYNVCDLLIQERVSLTMENLANLVGGREISLETVKKAVQHLKDTNNWDPKDEYVSHALNMAIMLHNYDVYDLLVQEGVLITMKHVPHLILRSLDYVKTVVKQLKDTDSWDPKCDDAPKALAKAFSEKEYDVCDLLIEEGVSLTMKNLPHVIGGSEISLEAVKKAMQHLKDTNNWDPKDEYVSHALNMAIMLHNYDVYDLLVQEGVLITMKHVPHLILRSLDYVKTVVKQLKDTDSWDPKCDDAPKALAKAFSEKEYDVCDLLIEEGVSLTMKNLPHVIGGSEISLEAVKKAMQHLKDTKNWDLKCEDVSKALAEAYRGQKYDVCDLLIEEGVSLTMKNLPHVIGGSEISLEAVKKAMQHLKDTKNWDPKCEDVSKALAEAYRGQKYDVCDLLIEEGVLLTMKNLPHMVGGSEISLKAVKKAVQHLKDTNNWDPKCEDALKALAISYRQKKYDVRDLLIKEGVSLTMKNLPHVVGRFDISLKAVKKVVQHLKDTYNWDPKCDDASKALEEAYGEQKYDVCDFLNQEGVRLTMKNIPGVVYHVLLEKVKKAIQYLNKFVVCDLVIQDRVSLTIKNLHLVRPFQVSLKTVKKGIEHLKEHENWDAKSDEASEALANAYSAQMYDVCDLLLEEAVSLKMKNFPGVVWGFEVSLEAVKKAMEHLKDTDNWDPKCDDASKALANAYSKQKYDVCDLLIQEGVLLTMQTLDGVVKGFHVSLEAVKKALQHLKNTDNWDPSSEHASKALENAYVLQKYDVCDLLFQEGVSLSMKNVPGVVYSVSLEYVKKAIQHLNKYDLFDLLVLKRVSLSMKNLPCAEGRSQVSLEAVKKVIQHLKDTGKWDPGCDNASEALANAYSACIYDVCDVLVQEGVLPNNEESSSNGAECSGIIKSS